VSIRGANYPVNRGTASITTGAGVGSGSGGGVGNV
jgi:hypothetical protein